MNKNGANYGFGFRQLAKGVLTGIGLFVIVCFVWNFVAAFIALFLNLDPSEAWWQRIGFFVVFFLPELLFAFIVPFVVLKNSGKYAKSVTLGACLILAVIDLTIWIILYPY